MVKVRDKGGKIHTLDHTFNLPKGEYETLTPKWDVVSELFNLDFKGVETEEDKRNLVSKMRFSFEKNGVIINVS